MSSKPMTLGQIAKKTKLKVGTVKGYIHQYSCFKLVGNGKGYGVEKPRTRDPGERVTNS
jgi:hypothetical protein